MNEQAIPFALGALLAVLGAVCAWGVRKRINEYAAKLEVDQSKADALTVWAVDAGQPFVAIATPLMTGLLLVKDSTALLNIVYAVLAIAGLAAFIAVLFQRPDLYMDRKYAGLTFVPALGIALNVVLGLAVQVFY